MSPSTTLERQPSAVARALGITFPFVGRNRVIAHLELEPEHVGADGAVLPGIVGALADSANGAGAALDLAPGEATRTVESKSVFLAAGRGGALRAEAAPLQPGRPVAVWRAQVFREDELVAEVTQTQLVVQSGGPAPLPAPARAPAPARPVADERWRQIVEGASKVIAAKGFAKATMREIAAAADMPVPTMYQYLERKEDILGAIYRFFMAEIVAALERCRKLDLAPKERLASAIRTVIDVFDRNHRFIKLLFQETRALTPEARRQVYALDAQYIAIFRDLLLETMRTGELRVRNPELAANFVWFLCTIWPLRYWSIGKFGEAAVTAEIVDFILSGLGAEPAASTISDTEDAS